MWKSYFCTTPDVVTYSIVKQGEIDGVNVKVTYAYTNNGVTKNKDVDFTKKYDKNTKIKVEVENNSTKRVKISALLGATSAGSVFVNANSNDVLEEIILTNNLTIILTGKDIIFNTAKNTVAIII